MWRFKSSKFKNAVSKVSQKGEDWFLNISVGSLPSYGNHIQCSAALVAFNTDQCGSGNLELLHHSNFGSKDKNIKIFPAHSSFVTDFKFCPYDDYVIATCSEDCHVKLWRITEEYLEGVTPCSPEVDLLLENKVEVLAFNPQVDCLLSTASGKLVQLWDVNTSKCVSSSSEHGALVQSVSWRASGNVLASCGQDKKLHIWDPRNSSDNMLASSFHSNRETKIVWLGDTEKIVTSGLGNERQREVFLRDIRNLSEPVASYTGNTSLKAYIPLFDPDTNMLFLVAKTDLAVIFCEIMDTEPFLQQASMHQHVTQILGAAILPKRALNVMIAEVNRLLLLSKDSIAPLSYQIPRKSYRTFHDDLFPETYAAEPSITVSQWLAGEASKVQKMSLEPSNETKCLIKRNHQLGKGSSVLSESISLSTAKTTVIEDSSKISSQNNKITVFNFDSGDIESKTEQQASSESGTEKYTGTESKSEKPEHTEVETAQALKSSSEEPPEKPVKKSGRTFGMPVSKFRHLNGQILPKETHVVDLPTLTKTVPGECDMFYANEERMAVPVGTGGNFLGILELSNPGRSPALADMPGVVSASSIADFCWDPFDMKRLAIGCDNGVLQLWIIPNNLSEKLENPASYIRCHTEKIIAIKFHPCAKNIIATAAGDLTISIWDLSNERKVFQAVGFMDQILSFCWSPNGAFLASVSKDQQVRLFNIRTSSHAEKEGHGPKGLRGARATFVLNGTHLAVSGFSKISERQIYLYNCEDLSESIEDISLDVSPATLIPHYLEDSSTLFLSGKGDAIIYAYEINSESPHFRPLSHYKCPGPQQALSFLPKKVCDVRKVEFARAMRLTTTTIEPISFYVPRLRMEFFQDDLFPPTNATWIPTMTSSEWISGANKPQQKIDLRPPDMTPLSEAPAVQKTPVKSSEEFIGLTFEGEVVLESSLAFLQNSKEKTERIVESMMSQCELQESELPQEEFEGVDPSEWDEEDK